MEQQNVQVEEGISLMDIVRLLLSKIKLLILVVTIGGILGGAFAAWRFVDVNYYGTKIEFYVNPEKPEESSGTSAGTAAGGSQYGVYGAYGRHVMDNMIKLLGSDSFAEKLLLNGEALPDAENTQWFGEEDLNADNALKNQALKAAVDAAQAPLQAVADAEKAYNDSLTGKAAAVKAFNEAETALNTEWRTTLFQKGLVQKATFNEKEYFDLETTRPDSLVTAYAEFVATQNVVSQQTQNSLNAEESWAIAKNSAKPYIEEALNIWRTSSLYAEQLSFYKESISYSYLEEDADYEDANNLARSFIYVTISIQNSDSEEGMRIGSMLLDRVKKVVPEYVAENMTVPDGYSGTNCQRITRIDDIHLTNPLYATKQAIKYAVLMAGAAGVIAAVLIIILDKSDKRLRDTEVIARKFNVPLLGIVPTIDELKIEQQGKKKVDKTSEVK